jgi:hypothetical protein
MKSSRLNISAAQLLVPRKSVLPIPCVGVVQLIIRTQWMRNKNSSNALDATQNPPDFWR